MNHEINEILEQIVGKEEQLGKTMAQIGQIYADFGYGPGPGPCQQATILEREIKDATNQLGKKVLEQHRKNLKVIY